MQVKEKNNASGILARAVSENALLLTNSLGGLKKDIDSLSGENGSLVMFGGDSKLADKVRIEAAAECETGKKCFSTDVFNSSIVGSRGTRYAKFDIQH